MSTGLQDRFSYVMKSFAKKERKEKPELLEENPDTEIVDELPRKDSHFKRVKGSDPCAATCRGKLQFRRSKLNQEINKHLMLRQGAENLLRAAENKRVRHATSLELSFVNSNLQYLKEELSDLNSSVEIYQSESKSPHIPMIPFGLKETKYINFTDVFKDYIQEHYSEDASQYIGAIQDLVDLRQAVRTPQRCEAGVDLLFQYYNQLYFIERRFFPPDRHLGIHFEWFDSLTGLPSCQRTVAFEKASVLFNMAALYSQIAAKQNREHQQQLDCAVDNYLRAAGIYRYIVDNFSNAPSRDLHPDVLEVLSTMLLTQAGECLLEKLLVVSAADESRQLDLIRRLEVAQEAAQVSNQYQQLTEQMSQPAIESSIPASWLQLVRIKSVYYLALAHHHFAIGLIEHEGPMSRRSVDILHVSQTDRHNQIARVENKVPRNTPQKNYLGKCHLREAISQHEEAQRLYRMSRELKKGEVVIEVLKDAMDVSSERYELISHEDEFNAPVDPPLIIGCSKYQIELTCPEFGQHPVSDLFRALGPLEVFNAHHHWSAPRQVLVDRGDGQGLGFSVKMEAPVVVVGVESDSLAEMVGLKEGDYIVGIDDQPLKWSSHTEVVSLIRRSGSRFSMIVVTPMDKPPSESESPQPPLLAPSISDKSWGSLSSSGVSSNESATSGSGSRKPSPSSTLTSQHGKWNPFKKTTGRSSHYITAHPTETR